MSEIAVQASFNSGEWAPTLYARVDQAKYKSGAALLENFFVDYRGGASTRAGSQFIIPAYDSDNEVRLITFQVSANVGYVLEFGNGYIRFVYNRQMILEDSFAISGASQANPCVITVVGNDFAVGDWIFVDGIVGMTQLNDKFYIVSNVAGNNVTLQTLRNVNVNSTGYTAYSSGGTAAKVYKINSPYTSADNLRLIKFAQSVNQMVLCHPNHDPYVLTIVEADNWTLLPLEIGASVDPPAEPTVTSTFSTTGQGGPGAPNYAYGVTSIDNSGQESSMSDPGRLTTSKDIRVDLGSNKIAWDAVQGAVAYNVYAATISYFGDVPLGVPYGFIGSCTGTSFIDSNIAPDFSQTPPVSQNPFIGSGVDLVTVTTPGTYTTVPVVTFVGTSTITATGIAELQAQGIPTITGAGAGYAVDDMIQFGNKVMIQVTGVSAGAITSWVVVDAGSITSGSTPANPVAQASTTGTGTGATATLTWGVGNVIVLESGAGYTAVPTVSFSAGSAAATTTLSETGNGNPTVPSFFQQRLVLAAPPGAPQSFYLSRPGAYFNFDISNPIRPDDAISGTLVSTVLNTIKSIISSTAGMLVLTDKASWLVNGGASGAAITPSAIVANAQSYSGANDVPPIVANYDILYVQSKGGGVRDLAFNIYYSVFTGTDISILSSHLFFGYEILEWCWAEHPFYNAWAVRDDGVMLTLTFLKEQEFIGWSHSVTDGTYKSVTSVTEDSPDIGNTDAVYYVVERTIEGDTVKYIERFADRIFAGGVEDAWCVDSGLHYDGAPATNFSGGEHLAGETCTGLADGEIIADFVMPANGNFTLATAASKVVVGKSFTCKLQTLALDLGEPTVQGKVKKINNVDIRVADALGLDIGPDFDNLVPMKDLIRGRVSSMLTGQSNQVISDLVTGDARTFLGAGYTVPGQYCIQQSKPYPATILGVFPAYTIGDDK